MSFISLSPMMSCGCEVAAVYVLVSSAFPLLPPLLYRHDEALAAAAVVVETAEARRQALAGVVPPPPPLLAPPPLIGIKEGKEEDEAVLEPVSAGPVSRYFCV